MATGLGSPSQCGRGWRLAVGLGGLLGWPWLALVVFSV